ncbi:MAG: hypothetical protein GC205_04965 [Bacteroidetes bacterium]|nr:hypothetical protein [Bacteroidota bacterium]
MAKGLSVFLLLSGVVLLLFTPDRAQSTLVLVGFGLSTAGWLLALVQSWKGRSLALMIGVGLLCRLLWLAVPPLLSDDWVRYLWDGLQAQAGLNPYEALPSALPGFAPQLLGQMNSPDYFSIYPPVAQAVFSLAAGLGGTDNLPGMLLMLRLILFAAECLTVGLLYVLLPQQHKSKVLVYALAPLAIMETAGNIHLEGLAICFSLLAIWCLQHWSQSKANFGRMGTWFQREGWLIPASLALSAAVGTKLHPVLLLLPLPFWIGWKRSIAVASLSALFFLASFIPYWSPVVAANLMDSMDLYFRNFEFNGSIFSAAKWLGWQWSGSNRIALIGPVLGLIAAAAIIGLSFYRKPANTQAYIATLFWIAIIHQALATTVHPWYLLPALAWSVFTPFWFGRVWAALIPLTYVAYATPSFHLPVWVLTVEYGLTLIVLIWDLASDAKRQEERLA